VIAMSSRQTPASPAKSVELSRDRHVASSSAELPWSLQGLETLGLAELKQRWAGLSAHHLPSRISRELLLQALAYEMQVKAYDGLSRWCRMKLKDAVDETGVGSTRQTQSYGGEADATSDSAASRRMKSTRRSPTPSPRHDFKPGTRLVRTWGGETHEVIVDADGQFRHRRETYKTLSQVARAITGTRWSGPRFFGLAAASRKTGEDDG
jgi:hypothetical protein